MLLLVLLAASPGALGESVGAANCLGRWLECRSDLVRAIFNSSTLPSRPPEWVLPGGGPQVAEPDGTYSMHGLPGPGRGTFVGDVSWENNLTALVWTVRSPFLEINTTVFWSRNTSSRAAINYPPPPYGPEAGVDLPTGPRIPSPDAPWGEANDFVPPLSDTLIMYHNGHETLTCTPNYDGVVDHFNQLGYDVFELMMPLIGCNEAPQYDIPGEGAQKHWWFQQFEDRGDYTMRYFIEPVALAVAHAKRLGYKHIVLSGLSGGGWTTAVAAAILTDIDLSIQISGSLPRWPTPAYPTWVPELPEGRNRSAVSPDIFHPPPPIGAGGDFEQWQARPVYDAIGGFVEMYVLAALEPHRHQLQILHEYDWCCFRGAGLFDKIKAFNAFVQAHVGGWMQTAVTAGNSHQVNPRDKVLVAVMVERLRRNGKLAKRDFAALPFDDLRVQ